MTDFPLNQCRGWIVPPSTALPNGTVIPPFSTLGEGCALGEGCTLGDRCTLEGSEFLRFMTLSNVDGSCRQILVIVRESEINIRAGCFYGTLDAFCERAADEGKPFYVAVVRAAALALRDAIGAKP